MSAGGADGVATVLQLPAGTFGATAIGLLLVGYVIVQRLAELRITNQNTAALIRAGGYEVGAEHYPLIVVLHAAWIIGLTVIVLAPLFDPAWGVSVSIPLLVIFAGVQVVRFWTLRTLGKRWTTRIIVVPGETLVARGPFKFVSHPNYLVVIAELALVPLIFGLASYATVFSALNAAMMTVRISAEERALAAVRGNG